MQACMGCTSSLCGIRLNRHLVIPLGTISSFTQQREHTVTGSSELRVRGAVWWLVRQSGAETGKYHQISAAAVFMIMCRRGPRVRAYNGVQLHKIVA